jgi:acetyl esterase/lipase
MAWLRIRLLVVLLLVTNGLAGVRGADAPTFTRTEDVIYGRKYGVALTLDVIAPKDKRNGAGIIAVMSGGWFSDHQFINPASFQEYLKRGYTVFAVVHGSNPKFTIPEAIQDMKRAARFIRFNAKKYGIDPERIGVTGGSAGGHLSLILGTAEEKGDPKAADPVDRVPSGVQAVACFFPPTDFLNYGETGKSALGKGKLVSLKAPFDFHELDPKTRKFVPVTDPMKIVEIGKEISPITHVTKGSAPTLIIHGDKDRIVPIQQAEIIVAKLKEAGVAAELTVKPGADHGWKDMGKDVPALADWFDKYLKKKEKVTQ